MTPLANKGAGYGKEAGSVQQRFHVWHEQQNLRYDAIVQFPQNFCLQCEAVVKCDPYMCDEVTS